MSKCENDNSVRTNGALDWSIEDLKLHLQAAVDLEFWTIPFYMSALYSIKDPASFAYQLVQSVVYQEMFHVVLAANIGNAYGLDIEFKVPSYKGKAIPHLNFSDDEPDPTTLFSPYSAEIGALDIERVNSMCLIEYPEWRTGHEPCFKKNVTEYGSIGEFYTAVELGAAELVGDLKGNRNQINIFDNYYNNFAQTTITRDGVEGLEQAVNIVAAITGQGEGQRQGDADIPLAYQNTTDDIRPDWTHFKKFSAVRLEKEVPHLRLELDLPVVQREIELSHIRLERKFPLTYEITKEPSGSGIEAQNILVANFAEFLTTLEELFSGRKPDEFGKQMATLGGNILNCWKNGAVPKFS